MIWTRHEEKVKDCVYIMKKLDEMGLYKKSVGLFYLIKILDYIMNEERDIVSFQEDVYPFIAEFFGVDERTIERNIRNFIMIVCRDCDNVEIVNNLQGLRCCKFIYKLFEFGRTFACENCVEIRLERCETF